MACKRVCARIIVLEALKCAHYCSQCSSHVASCHDTLTSSSTFVCVSCGSRGDPLIRKSHQLTLQDADGNLYCCFVYVEILTKAIEQCAAAKQIELKEGWIGAQWFLWDLKTAKSYSSTSVEFYFVVKVELSVNVTPRLTSFIRCEEADLEKSCESVDCESSFGSLNQSSLDLILCEQSSSLRNCSLPSQLYQSWSTLPLSSQTQLKEYTCSSPPTVINFSTPHNTSQIRSLTDRLQRFVLAENCSPDLFD